MTSPLTSTAKKINYYSYFKKESVKRNHLKKEPFTITNKKQWFCNMLTTSSNIPETAPTTY